MRLSTELCLFMTKGGPWLSSTWKVQLQGQCIASTPQPVVMYTCYDHLHLFMQICILLFLFLTRYFIFKDCSKSDVATSCRSLLPYFFVLCFAPMLCHWHIFGEDIGTICVSLEATVLMIHQARARSLMHSIHNFIYCTKFFYVHALKTALYLSWLTKFLELLGRACTKRTLYTVEPRYILGWYVFLAVQFKNVGPVLLP